MRRFVIGLVFVLTFVSCRNAGDASGDRIVAKVYDKTLHQSDLQGVLYDGIGFSDSIVRTKAFIDEWIRRQLVLHQAMTVLDESELDFSKQLEDYRNSLIIYKYEAKLLKQHLDTVVTAEEVSKYINDNNAQLQLDEEAARYIILNNRKKAMLEKTNNSLYNKAVKERIFEIY